MMDQTTYTMFSKGKGRLGQCAGLQKLQNMDIHGTCFSVGEEKPGLLNKMFEGLTSLHLRATSMPCSDIASPNLRCLTVIMRGLNDLPGAGSSIHWQILLTRSLGPLQCWL